jgi:hypothetical protein
MYVRRLKEHERTAVKLVGFYGLLALATIALYFLGVFD